MSIYDDIVPFQPPSAREIEIEQGLRDAEKTKEAARTALALATIQAAKIVYELMMESNDEQVQLRAAEMIFSRTIPKVAAKHVEDQDVVETNDVAALRESIMAEINKNRGDKNG